jgi:hypothetical protein
VAVASKDNFTSYKDSTLGIGSSLAANIRLGWKWLAVTHAASFYTGVLIIASKMFYSKES